MEKERAAPFFVAEISANHLGSLNRARELVQAAIFSGANAVKFQTYTANTMTLNIDSPDFRISGDHSLWGGRKLYDLYEEAHTPWEWHEELFEICHKHQVIPFSTPFDQTAVDFLETLNAQLYKVSSMESGDIPLIKRIARLGKPLMISTGATTLTEIADAVSAVRDSENSNLTLLVCTSAYPALPEDSNLKRMTRLKEMFGVEVGLSDHTLGIGVSVAAIALGARVIEKHFTLRRHDGGADSAFSMEPEEFEQLVREGKNAYAAIGNSEWQTQESENESRRLRRSLYVTEQVSAGDKVTVKNVRAIRPNGGLPPKYFDEIIGKTFKKSCEPGTPMSLDLID